MGFTLSKLGFPCYSIPMPSDAHCHPFDMKGSQPNAEAERNALNLTVAASSWNGDELYYHKELAQQAAHVGGPSIALCFGVHPQLPLVEPRSVRASLESLYQFAESGVLSAIGEVGFDLYNEAYQSTEPMQDELFILELELAKARGLPLVLHLRRAMHKVFTYSKQLAALPAVVLHSYSGTYEEALALRKRGIAAYCSFGTTIALNHRKTMRACALLPQDMLLFETDAPYQPLRGQPYSTYRDIFTVVRTAAMLRSEAGCMPYTEEELHQLNDDHFKRIFFQTSS